MVIPPDGGFAWVILVISFIAQAVVDGVIYCTTPIMDGMKNETGFSSSERALITSCQTGFYFCSGPIASAAINKFGFRIVGIAGGILCTLGILIASFLSNYFGIIFCYGVVTGCGVGMVWASSQLIIGYYFEKFRPLANGVGSAGSGLGVIVFAVINVQSIAVMTWRNVLQLHASIMFLVAVSCFAYKPVPPTKVGRIVEEVKDDDDDDDSISNESEEVASAFYSRVMDTDLDAKSRINIGTRSAMNLVSRHSMAINQERKRCGCMNCCRKTQKRASLSHKRYIIEPSPFDRQDMFFTGVADYSKAEEAQTKEDMNIISGQEEKVKTLFLLQFLNNLIIHS